jgi:hypothetical protein
LPNHGKALARRPAEYAVDFSVSDARQTAYLLAGQFSNGTRYNNGLREIEFVRRTVDRIDFHSGNDIETRLLKAEAQAPSTREQVYPDWASICFLYSSRAIRHQQSLAIYSWRVDRIYEAIHKAL